MAVRNIVKIDEAKCTGCGLCVSACAEGAIEIIDGKARLISDAYCDGLGACLGQCPEDAIRVEQREAEEFDEEAAKAHLAQQGRGAQEKAPPSVCPGLQAQALRTDDELDSDVIAEVPSQLRHWPVQLKLIGPSAACLADADLLLVADCVPFAIGDFHNRFLKGRSVVVGCPKLDDPGFYVEKLAAIIKANKLRSLTVIHMEVPCCSGLTRIARQAIARSGADIPFEDVTVSLRGEAIGAETVQAQSPPR